MAEKEYIEREAVLAYMSEIKEVCISNFEDEASAVIAGMISGIKDDEIPTADVVPVVHCKNCEYNNECSVQDFGEMHQNDFCSRGKRRSDND